MKTIISMAVGTTVGLTATGLIMTFVVTRKSVMRWITNKSMENAMEFIKTE